MTIYLYKNYSEPLCLWFMTDCGSGQWRTVQETDANGNGWQYEGHDDPNYVHNGRQEPRRSPWPLRIHKAVQDGGEGYEEE